MPIINIPQTGVKKNFDRLCLNFEGSMPELQAVCLKNQRRKKLPHHHRMVVLILGDRTWLTWGGKRLL